MRGVVTKTQRASLLRWMHRMEEALGCFSGQSLCAQDSSATLNVTLVEFVLRCDIRMSGLWQISGKCRSLFAFSAISRQTQEEDFVSMRSSSSPPPFSAHTVGQSYRSSAYSGASSASGETPSLLWGLVNPKRLWGTGFLIWSVS